MPLPCVSVRDPTLSDVDSVRRHLFPAAVLVVVAVVTVATPALAAPTPTPPAPSSPAGLIFTPMGARVAALQAQAESLQGQIIQQSRSLDEVAARAAAARAEAGRAAARAEAAFRYAADAATAADRTVTALRRAAVRVYVLGPGDHADDLSELKSMAPYDLARDRTYSQSAFAVSGDVLVARRRAKQSSADALRRLNDERRTAAQAAARVAQEEQAAHDGQAALQATLAQVDSQAAGVAAGDRAALAAQAAQHLSRPDALELAPGVIPPVMPQASAAISLAFGQLGKPYVWGATGPSSFDCSGLLVYSWGLSGVQLPRTSYQMYEWTVPIPLSALQPGDLVFFGESQIHHVGMYVGGGTMIQAPHSGDVVKLASIWWDNLVGFGRIHGPDVTVSSRQFQPPWAVTAPGGPVARPVKPGAGPVPAEPPHPGDPLDGPPPPFAPSTPPGVSTTAPTTVSTAPVVSTTTTSTAPPTTTPTTTEGPSTSVAP